VGSKKIYDGRRRREGEEQCGLFPVSRSLSTTLLPPRPLPLAHERGRGKRRVIWTSAFDRRVLEWPPGGFIHCGRNSLKHGNRISARDWQFSGTSGNFFRGCQLLSTLAVRKSHRITSDHCSTHPVRPSKRANGKEGVSGVMVSSWSRTGTYYVDNMLTAVLHLLWHSGWSLNSGVLILS